jgi:predicted  nucleic acid-binding Zn-ribbon protein
MIKMGKRYSKEDLDQVNSLIEGFTDREIAQKLNRSEAGIRNIRYRKKLIKLSQSEIGILRGHEDELRKSVEALRGEQQKLSKSVKSLREEKEKLEAFLNLDKIQLQSILAQALTALKQQRPDLFILSDQEKMNMLVGEFFRRVQP